MMEEKENKPTCKDFAEYLKKNVPKPMPSMGARN